MGLFTGLGFYVQREGRRESDFWSDIRLIKHHGGETYGGPSIPRVTHIIVEIPRSLGGGKKNLQYPLPSNAAASVGFDKWDLDTLVAKFGQGSHSTVVQCDWIDDCIKKKVLLYFRNNCGGWVVTGRPTSTCSRHTASWVSSMGANQPARIHAPLRNQSKRAPTPSFASSSGARDLQPRGSQFLTPPVSAAPSSKGGRQEADTCALSLTEVKKEPIDGDMYPSRALTRVNTPAYPVPAARSYGPPDHTTRLSPRPIVNNVEVYETKRFSLGAPSSSRPAPRPEPLPQTAQTGIFTAGLQYPLTFFVDSPDTATSKTSLEMLITVQGGGVLTSLSAAQFVLLPLEVGQDASEPRHKELIGGIGLHPCAQVVSSDWVWSCLKSSKLISPREFIFPRGSTSNAAIETQPREQPPVEQEPSRNPPPKKRRLSASVSAATSRRSTAAVDRTYVYDLTGTIDDSDEESESETDPKQDIAEKDHPKVKMLVRALQKWDLEGGKYEFIQNLDMGKSSLLNLYRKYRSYIDPLVPGIEVKTRRARKKA